MHFTKKDGLVLFLYVLLIAVQFWGIDRLHLPENGAMALRLAIILLNAFIVLYAYRGVLGTDWKAFRQQRWTKWLIILAAFLIISGVITLIRKMMAGAGEKVAEEAAAALEAAVQDTASDDVLNPIKAMPLYTFVLSLLVGLVPLLSAVTEEVVFRHVLMFKHSGNRAVQYGMLLLSSAAFGLIHYQALGSVSATIPYIFVALILGSLYLWKKNIWYNIFAHLLFNGLHVVTALFGMIVQRLAG